jgi:hypothetical protein
LSYDAGDLDAASAFVPTVLKALSRSRIPFLELKGLDSIDPAIEAEMERNRRLFASGSTTAGSGESQRSPDDATAPAVPVERPEPSTAIRSHTGMHLHSPMISICLICSYRIIVCLAIHDSSFAAYIDRSTAD